MKKYSDYKINVYNWAELKQTSEGKWQRIWNIRLKKPIAETLNLEEISKILSHEDFEVSVKVDQGIFLTVYVTTQRWGWEDELFFETFKLFAKIEQKLGTIATIQGQSRNIWSFWILRYRTEEH